MSRKPGTMKQVAPKEDSSHDAHRKRPRKVLQEEDYLATLGVILKRDFFPDLARLEAQYDYLSAVEKSDLLALKEAALRLNLLSSPTDPALNTDLTLDEFQANFTSEDNASFEALLDRVNAIKREKYIKVYGAPARIVDNPDRKLLLLPSSVDTEKVDLGLAAGKRLEPRNTRLATRENSSSKQKEIQEHYWDIVKEIGADNQDTQSISTFNDQKSYELVESTPLIRPGVDATPLFTWGNIESTPQRIHEENTPSTSGRKYKIPITPARDQIGLSLATRAAKNRASSSKMVSTPYSGSLRSPAARHILRSTSKTVPGSTNSFSFDSYKQSPKLADDGSSTPIVVKKPSYGNKANV